MNLIVGLCIGPVAAESLYQVSRKIPPRTQQSSPAFSSDPQKEPEQAAPVPEASAQNIIPAASSELETSMTPVEIPVSYRASQQPASAKKKTKPSRQRVKRTSKSDHPIVIAPVPLLPAANSETKPKAIPAEDAPTDGMPNESFQKPLKTSKKQRVARQKSRRQPVQDTVSSTQPALTTTPHLEKQESDSILSGRQAAPTLAQAKRSPIDSRQKKRAPEVKPDLRQDTKASDSKHRGKTLVYFPQALPDGPQPQKRATATENQNRKIYPVGYRPYVSPVARPQRDKMEKAISAYNRGNYYGQQHQMDAALAEYQKALTSNPMFADAYVGLAMASMYKNDWENVIEWSRQALKMKANFMEPANIAQAQFNLSAAYCVTDHFRTAKRYYKKVKAQGHPDTEQLWSYLQKNCKP